jgi:hypothetical protein
MKALTVLLIAAGALLAGTTVTVAEEGMWPPYQLPELRHGLTKAGLEIDPGKLTDLTAHPMNAVISLGGCTASFVSPGGLVVTNHHCAYRSIQYNSTEERNLLEEGFLAKSRSDELPAGPGSRVLVTVAVDDVTDRILGELAEDLGGYERYQAIEEREKAVVAECEKDEGHRCNVYSFYGGLQYNLIKQLEIRDVRLVYAPADGVGNYGGDIDNWMWPRHTGDFSFYRAYVGPDGKPADHADDNVPYHPEHHLTVSRAGLKEGDFVMVAGYPFRTNRYRLAREVESAFEWYYPTRRELLAESLAIIENETADRPDAAIKYAGRVAGLNNSMKNYQGLLESYPKTDVVERKRLGEQQLRAWVADDPGRDALYGNALQTLEKLVEKDETHRERDLYYASFARQSSLLRSARTLYRLSYERGKPDPEREPGYQERDLRRIKERLTRLDRTFDPAVDRAVWRQMILRYAAIPPDQHVEAFDAWFGIRGNEIDEAALDRRLDEMYEGARLGDREVRLGWIDAKPEAFENSDDPFIRFAVALFEGDMAREREDKELRGQFRTARPRYMDSLIAYRNSLGQAVYPDANGTLRVTYGNVKGYSPKDAVVFTPFTCVDGILEKDTGNDPFDAPPALLDAVEQRRFGEYADPVLHSVPVDFLSNVDSTGGNSGSPTLNSRGELVGLLFDGTYESIISDWDFVPKKTRSIHVDIRYALWVMDSVDGAEHLVQEMSSPEKRSARR